MSSSYKSLILSKKEDVIESVKRELLESGVDVVTQEEWKPSFSETFQFYFVDSDELEALQAITVPTSSFVIGITEDRSFDEGRRWVKAGAYDVMVFPDEIDRLSQLIVDIQQSLELTEQSFNRDSGNGIVHAFYSAKGGSGTTLLSILTAQSLRIHHDKRVILIDLNAQFGGVEPALGLEFSRSYYDLQPVLQELSLHHIENVSIRDERTGIDVLTGPANPAKAEEINEELITKVIRTCRAHYDHVILDVPSAISTISFTGLSESTAIHYILTPDSLGLRAFKNAMDLFERFQLSGRNHPVSLLLNRTHPKGELAEKDIARLLSKEVTASVRSDYFGLQPVLNMGEPFYKKKNDRGQSKATKDMKLFVDKVLM
ncbi:AAA family ATPase [Alkalihalobacillus sp. CinArs1]|uniref:AAA family ATPase n=1 Tax=Alkalihalobacillus sp. CinArs1 TaxID=2995314 RepID=UPI0022DD3EFA|nr:AAA family ATPase [Alkalihalobacillus sp. CinArs1]